MKLSFCFLLVVYLSALCFQQGAYAESDIPLLKTEQLHARYWLQQLTDANTVLLNQAEISARNVQTYAQQASMTELASLPASFSAAALTAIIVNASANADQPRFYSEGGYGRNVRFSPQSNHTEKLAALNQAAVGDLIYRPGHVMLYLGAANGEPFVIHSVHELAYFSDTNADTTAAKPVLYQGVLNGVAVTPLTPLQLTANSSYLDKIYAIKSLR
jgi:hypothetical protein